MVYAVAMTTIRNFERALGRVALWTPRRYQEENPQNDLYVQRLRVYPHALREANAYYSPEKKALLFGYFPAEGGGADGHLPGGLVFTCLSHDIIAHETTHALLDGMHRRFVEPSNPDVLAFHEAFADIVALFQHFSLPEVLRHQIARTRGDLRTESLLGQLAQQFGQATGHHGALRDALGRVDPRTGRWQRAEPDPTALSRTFEPHARGAILVSAVFNAFIAIYRRRTEDLLRIATGGSGVLPDGALHPDLVNRLADEAAKSARHVLVMCIRALDYCPPVDITFGEYLGALITADHDLVRDDDLGYRIAVVAAFRRCGIYPRDVRTLSVDSVRWGAPLPRHQTAFRKILAGETNLRVLDAWRLTGDRRRIYESARKDARALHSWPKGSLDDDLLDAMGLSKFFSLEVHSVRPARRIGPDGQFLEELVVEITQHRPSYLDPSFDASAGSKNAPPPDFVFRGGCTLLIDPETGTVRYCIAKSIENKRRLERQRRYTSGETDLSLHAIYFQRAAMVDGREPFALLHRAHDELAARSGGLRTPTARGRA